MAKTYFTKDFIKFFKELKKNNNRDWFHANKQRYEPTVKLPMIGLVADLLKFRGFDDQDPKKALFRIYRDVRFSKDKSPYKVQATAMISPGGRKDMQYPGNYLHIEPGNIMLAGGCYMPDKEKLSQIRQSIIHKSKDVNRILKAKKFVEYFGDSVYDGEKNKRLPKEFQAHAAYHPLVFNKQYFFASRDKDERILTSDGLFKYFTDRMKAGDKWNQFLKEAMNLE